MYEAELNILKNIILSDLHDMDVPVKEIKIKGVY
jgi:hypothetical protein